MRRIGITDGIYVFGSEEEAARIMRVIGEAFTEEEIRIMSRHNGVSIYVIERKDGRSGEYVWKQKGVGTPYIEIAPDARDDSIVHEFVHHLRTMDNTRTGIARTSFPVNENGEIIESSIYKEYMSDIENAEESATVAETTARRHSEGGISGYFSMITGVFPLYAYIHDRDLLTNSKDAGVSKDIRGKEAVDAVNRMYDRTKISDARIFPDETDNRTAKMSWDMLKDKGLTDDRRRVEARRENYDETRH